MSALLIGLTGHDAAGRAIIADHLCRELDFLHIVIEQPFMQAAATIIGIDVFDIPARMKSHAAILPGVKKHENILHDSTPTFASFVRLMRAEFCEGQHEDLIPQLLASRLEAITSNEGKVSIVVSDLLYETEAELLRSRGGVIFHVKNSWPLNYGPRRIDHPLSKKADDRTLANTGTTADLLHQVDSIIARLRGFTGQPEYLPFSSAQIGDAP